MLLWLFAVSDSDDDHVS